MQDKQFGLKNRLRCIATALALIASYGLTQSVSAFPPPPPGDQIILTGFARDFIGSQHPDFNAAAPDAGFGHYAGNVSQVLGADGSPLQVHGVTDFTIDFGTLIPGTPYAARLTVLGAEITSGGDPMPVTIRTETNSDTFEPFGLFNDPNSGSVNDGANPRHFIYSLDDIYSAGTPISVTATSWLPSGGGGGGGGDVGYTNTQEMGVDTGKVHAVEVTMPEDGMVDSISIYAKNGTARMGIYTDNGTAPGNLIVETGQVSLTSGYAWQTGTVPATFLPAGDYWVAAYTSAGSTMKYNDNASTPPATALWRRFIFDATTAMPAVLDPDVATNSLGNREPALYFTYSVGDGGVVGYYGDTMFQTGDPVTTHRAMKVTMPEDGIVKSISANVKDFSSGGVQGEVKYAIYSDNAGEPGNVIVETGIGVATTEYSWITLPVPSTALTAGTYWIAFTAGPETKYTHRSDTSNPPATHDYIGISDDAYTNGFIADWATGTPQFIMIRTVDIYFTYEVGGTYTEHLSARSGDNSPYVLVLRDGDSVPNIPGFQDQNNLAVFVDPFVNVATQKVVLDDNQAIYLFELGTTNLNSAAADFQDLVILVTLANDPVYFFTPGAQSSGLEPIGYKVNAQWRDSSFNNIAPHTYTPGLGDLGGVSGVTSSGGVTSPATYFEWFRDILGENMGMASDLTLTDDGSGVYEFLTNNFYPIDGLLYGNEGGGRNDNFTYAVSAWFTYDASDGQFLEFEGGDGAWIFIDGKLVIDLGGVRSNVRQYADLDRLGLDHGQDYEMRLFYANRNRSKEFKFRTNLFLTPGGLLGSPSGFND